MDRGGVWRLLLSRSVGVLVVKLDRERVNTHFKAVPSKSPDLPLRGHNLSSDSHTTPWPLGIITSRGAMGKGVSRRGRKVGDPRPRDVWNLHSPTSSRS